MATTVHSVRFYNLLPVSVKCMSCDEEAKLLAVARADNTIEVWNISYTPHIERTILGVFDVVEGLDWYKGRLFSVGHQGSIIEYDLFRQTPKSMHPVTSGCCWCISVKPEIKQLAAGTEDGYINIFSIEDDEIMYKKILDRQEGKILCIAWNATGTHLVTGSLDTVRIWDVESGHAIHRMNTGRLHTNQETKVWSLAVTDDFTIISGDSRGKLCFWDGNLGLGISSYLTHKADVRAVCLAKDQNTVYCAGVDPLIATYERVKIREGDTKGRWVKSIQRFIHDHDVHSLVICDNKLYSAGVDGYIAMSSYPPKVLFKYPPLLQTPSVHCSNLKRLLMLRYPNSLVVWRLGQKDVCPPTKLLEWKPLSEVRIRCSAISPDGRWMACSTQESFKLYSLIMDDKKPSISKVKVSSKENLASLAMCFSPNSSLLVLGTIEGCVVSLSVSSDQPSILHSFDAYKDKDFKDSIRMLAVSSDSQYIVAADIQSNVIVWQDGKIHTKLPRYNCPITAMAIHPSTNEMVLVYADHKIMEYSLRKRKYTKFSKILQDQHPKQWLNRHFPVHNLTFDERNENIIILHDDSTILVIDKDKELPEVESKIPRLGTYIDDNTLENSNQHPFSNTPQHAFHVIKKYKHLVYFGSLCDGEMVAVEISPVTLYEKLPPSLKQKRFGRM
ncbi:U3 small nucleolar RNA-associated protein 4 homolog [Halyomorpha halys]|uniref:U3 small nucleolar RNA-associated protein 4 homolog n=1 Tax=Halyomorpha halys TaxID=286706 RepID=UPI0006D500DC|nr:U3 small nucleolar RNA-associated protein 4 homolog [Halyomorpha halys]